jgi:DNA-binding NtrC family response regulator
MHKSGVLYAEAVREFRKAFIIAALREHKGNQSKAARGLGMHRNTLNRTASVLGIDLWALRPGSRRLPQSEHLVPVARRSSR